MMDDVVGLVMVQVISNLGGSASSFSATTVIRPVFVSLAFAVLVPLVCRLVVKPATLFLNKQRVANPTALLQRLLSKRQATVAIHTGILLAFVAGGSFAGTSNLFTAYLAGACVSWWDSEIPHMPLAKAKSTQDGNIVLTSGNNDTQIPDDAGNTGSFSSANTSGVAIYERYYQQAVERILKPLFFVNFPPSRVLHFLTINFRHRSGSPSPSPKCSPAPSSGAVSSTRF